MPSFTENTKKRNNNGEKYNQGFLFMDDSLGTTLQDSTKRPSDEAMPQIPVLSMEELKIHPALETF